jgi:pimeloyl-ACP methyl ester carboxylesterase
MRNRIVIALLAALLCVCGCAKQEQSKGSLVKTESLGEAEMDYLRFGKETGEKLVILPGLALKSVMGSAEGIQAAYAPLARDYDVYLFDHIREEPEGYTIADMARDILAAFDGLGLGKVHLMGVSMGGMVAQTIALSAPQRVRSLILCSTALDTEHSDPAVLSRWKKLAEERNTRGLTEAFGESVYTPAFFEQYRDVILASGEGASEQDYRNFLISLEAVRGFTVRSRAGEITCPVLVLGAGEDRVLGPEAAPELAEALHAASFIYEGRGHGVYDEAPDYLSRINDFLRSV